MTASMRRRGATLVIGGVAATMLLAACGGSSSSSESSSAAAATTEASAAASGGAVAAGCEAYAAYAGNEGTTLANDSVDAVRKVVTHTPAPPGVKAYVTGPAALSDDMHVIGNASLAKITLFTLGQP